MTDPNATPPLTVSRHELLVAGSDQTFREFIHGFLAFTSLVESIRDKFGELLGLSGAQYELFITIRHRQGDEGISVSHVAQHLYVSGAFVTMETRKLVKLGLVEKRPNPEDGRSVLLRVTPKGDQMLEDLAVVQRPINDTLFECLDSDEFRLIAARMGCLIRSGQRAQKQMAYLSQLEETTDLFDYS